ncbi:MAG: type II secretion system protein J [Candidatus Sericytochromatia bacterium]
MKKGFNAISGFSRIELLSTVIILAATLGMGMRTYLMADNHLQLAASDVQFQAEAQLALLQMSNELRLATDAQIVGETAGQMPATVIFVKAVMAGSPSAPTYQWVRYSYQVQNGTGALLRTVRSHGSQPKLQPADLQMAPAKFSQAGEQKQVLLSDARSNEDAPKTSQRLNQLTLRLLASAPEAIIRKNPTKS